MTKKPPEWNAAYHALRDHCALASRPSPDVLQLLGDDRKRFLNGQVTCDVSTLEPGSGVYGFFTTGKGQIQADVAILALADRLWLQLPTGLGDEIRKRLQKYIIVDRVEIRSLEGWVTRTFAGPSAVDTVRDLWSLDAAGESWSHGAFESAGARDGVEARWVREARLGVDAVTLWLPEAQAIDRAVADAGLASAPYEALEALRIEAGEPRFGVDFGSDNLPQETGLDAAVSYTKGCYLGQEVVARLHYRGQVSRQLCGLVFSADVEAAPAAGTELLLDERAAGTLRSTTYSPTFEAMLGFGLLQRRAFEPGTRLQLAGGGEAQVHALPFSLRPQAAGE